MLKLYKAYLIPIMCYGSEIWGFQEDKSIEKVELWILKHMLHVLISTPTMAVRGELGQLPLHLWWKERILKYWNRISSGDIPNLLKDAANLLIHNVSSNSNNWVGKIMTIYNNSGLSSYFSAVWGCDPATRNRIMCVLRDKFLQKWHENLLRDQSVRGQGGS